MICCSLSFPSIEPCGSSVSHSRVHIRLNYYLRCYNLTRIVQSVAMGTRILIGFFLLNTFAWWRRRAVRWWKLSLAIRVHIPPLSRKSMCAYGWTVTPFSHLNFIPSRGYYSKAHNLGFHVDKYKAQFDCEMIEKPHSRLLVFSWNAFCLQQRATSV